MNRWTVIGALTAFAAVMLGVLEYQAGSSAGVAIAPVGLVLAMLLFLAGIAVHEAGHLFVGLALGLECRSVLIGPLRWIRERDQWVFSLTNDARLAGYVTFAPYRADDAKKKHIAMFAAGPVSSLLFAALLTPVVMAVDNPGVVLWPALQIIYMVFLWLMVLSFVPARIGGMGTDGYWIWATLTGNKSALGLAALNRVAADLKAGKHELEWNEEDVRAMGEVESPLNLVVVVHALLFWHSLAKQDTAQAREHVIESLKAIHKMKANIPGLRFTAFASAAFSAAVIDGDAEVIREFVSEIDYTPPEAKSILTQIDSWLAGHEGREVDAANLAEQSVREVVDGFPDSASTVWSHVENYRFIGEVEYARAVAVAEELIGPRPVPPAG